MREEGRESGMRNANFAWQDSFRRKVRSFSRSLLSHASLTREDEGSHPISHPLYMLQHTIKDDGRMIFEQIGAIKKIASGEG